MGDKWITTIKIKKDGKPVKSTYFLNPDEGDPVPAMDEELRDFCAQGYYSMTIRFYPDKKNKHLLGEKTN